MSRYNTRTQRWLKRLMPASMAVNYQQRVDDNNFNRWERNGKPSPPPHIVKVRTVARFQALTNNAILVESGTFMGDMIWAQINRFQKIYSIELSKELWENAVEAFKAQSNVKLLCGDSGKVLHDLVPQLDSPAVFWLDGHYSGGNTALGEKISPIYEELKAIFKSDIAHCVLIDDARLFNGTDDYPTVEDLKTFILQHRPEAKIEIEADTISVIYN